MERIFCYFKLIYKYHRLSKSNIIHLKSANLATVEKKTVFMYIKIPSTHVCLLASGTYPS